MAADAPDKVTKVGEYEVLVGGAPVAFWPLLPGTTLDDATPPLVCSPNDPTTTNTVFLPVFGMFDVLIRMSDDVKDEWIDQPRLLRHVSGRASSKKGDLVRDDQGNVIVTFAVDQAKTADGDSWQGTLRLTAPQDVNGKKVNRTIELHLKAKKYTHRAGLAVFFPVHKKPKKGYAWTRLRVVDATDGSTPIAGATALLKVLRDNFSSGFADRNRRVALATDAGGYFQCGADRTTIGVPVEWPLILNAKASGYVPRGHLVRVAEAEAAKDPDVPHEPAAPLRMTRIANASLAGKSILLDPGHGVVYALAPQRRSQEWFVAHMLADRIAAILVGEHGMDPDNILWTKTAGFGLIEPGQVHATGAPEIGRNRFVLDLPMKRIRAKVAAVRLDEMASLLITRHLGDADTVVEPTAATRNAWLNTQAAAVTAIVARINNGLAAQYRRVRPGSLRWHEGTHRYVYTQEHATASPGTDPVVADHVDVALALTDWFQLDAAALDVLADRTARWSIQCEIGGDNAFQTRARDAMKAAGALAYMKAAILRYVNVMAPHPYLTKEMAWGPTERRNYLNNHGARADLLLTLHENASPSGKGGMILVGRQDPPPDDQVRIAKIFVKYLDPFDQGLRQGGITMPDPGKSVGLLDLANTRRDKYAYFELEFMDAPDPATSGRYRYEDMTTGAFIERVSRQIVCGVIEVLLDRQGDLDSVTYNSGTKIKGLW